ncbi:hypothetical protein DFH06DRAFT_1484033 [Mycena polygramma]|nr:hypothetical protein DFH06DRAFT_1484033 [Mycena polygramma]
MSNTAHCIVAQGARIKLSSDLAMQLVVSRRAATKGYVLGLLLLSFALFTPILLTRYTEMGFLAASLYWTAETYALGFTTIMFILALVTFCALILDMHKFLVGLSSAEPVTLNGHIATRAVQTSPPIPSTLVNLLEPPTFLGKVFIFLCLTYFVQVQWKYKHIVSTQRPLLENLVGAALYLVDTEAGGAFHKHDHLGVECNDYTTQFPLSTRIKRYDIWQLQGEWNAVD